MPDGQFDDPHASIGTYRTSFRDMVETLAANGARSDLPELVQDGVDAGLDDKHITVLTRQFAR